MYPDYMEQFSYYLPLFTAMLVHADLLHLLSNMVALLIFGMLVENKYSIIQYLIIYFLSGLIGNIVSFYTLPQSAFSLGASGCIFGVMGAYYVSFTAYDKRMIFYAIGSSALMVALSIGTNINSWAHLVGAVGGLLFGFIFTQYNKKKGKIIVSKPEDDHESIDDNNDKWHYKPSSYEEEGRDEEIPDY
jgi:rhomboid protease GluP